MSQEVIGNDFLRVRKSLAMTSWLLVPSIPTPKCRRLAGGMLAAMSEQSVMANTLNSNPYTLDPQPKCQTLDTIP